MVWDLGTWEPHAPAAPAASVAAGELHADVTGHKLRGRLVLVRSGRDRADSNQWLLLHKKDEYAVAGWDPEDHPRSVLSGRTNDEVKAHPQRMWRADLPPAQASVAVGDAAAAGEPDADRPDLDEYVAAGPDPAELDALPPPGPGRGTWGAVGHRPPVTNLD